MRQSDTAGTCCRTRALRSKTQVWDGLVHAVVIQMDDHQGPPVEHRELCSMSCGSLDGRGVWGRMDTCVCVAESLCCPPKSIITLLIGYTPIQKKKNKPASLSCQPGALPSLLSTGTHLFQEWGGLFWLDALAGEGVFSHCQNEGERSLSVPGSGGRHKVLLLRTGAEWEPLSLTCMREEEGESLLRPEWDGGDHSLLEPEHLPCPSPSLQHIHQPSPDHHPFSLAWATVFQLDSAPLLLQSSTHAAQVDFLKWRSDHPVQGICRLAG